MTRLSAHVIRIWEQRYRAVEPQRTPTSRPLYLPGHIESLGLLREVTNGGHSIGQVAQLPTEHLRRLAAEAPRRPDGATPSATGVPFTDLLVDECLAAIKTFDARALDGALERGARELGALGLLQRVLAPLTQSIGNSWRDGVLTAAHEHFAAAALRVFLGNAASPVGSLAHAPVLVVALLVGGRALPAYRDFVVSLGAVPVDSLVHLGATPDGLRKVRKTAKTMNPLRFPNHE